MCGQRVEEAKLRRAKELRREMTPTERMLWERVRRNQLDGYHFRRQQVIAGFVADFYCHAAGLVVEIDGSVHDSRKEYDTERDRIFGGLGIVVFRVSNDDVASHMGDVLTHILELCRSRSAEFQGRDRSGQPSPSPRGGGAASGASGEGSA